MSGCLMFCRDLEVRGVKCVSSFVTNAPLAGILVGSIRWVTTKIWTLISCIGGPGGEVACDQDPGDVRGERGKDVAPVRRDCSSDTWLSWGDEGMVSFCFAWRREKLYDRFLMQVGRSQESRRLKHKKERERLMGTSLERCSLSAGGETLSWADGGASIVTGQKANCCTCRYMRAFVGAWWGTSPLKTCVFSEVRGEVIGKRWWRGVAVWAAEGHRREPLWGRQAPGPAEATRAHFKMEGWGFVPSVYNWEKEWR